MQWQLLPSKGSLFSMIVMLISNNKNYLIVLPLKIISTI